MPWVFPDIVGPAVCIDDIWMHYCCIQKCLVNNTGIYCLKAIYRASCQVSWPCSGESLNGRDIIAFSKHTLKKRVIRNPRASCNQHYLDPGPDPSSMEVKGSFSVYFSNWWISPRAGSHNFERARDALGHIWRQSGIYPGFRSEKTPQLLQAAQ